jgi:hypothetical protein
MALRVDSRSPGGGIGANIRSLDTASISPVQAKSGDESQHRDSSRAHPEGPGIIFAVSGPDDDDDGTYAPIPPHLVRY